MPIDVELGVLKSNGLTSFHELLDLEHKKLFTYTLSSDVEIVNLRVVAEEARVDLAVKQLAAAELADPPESLVSGQAKLIFNGKEYEGCPIWDRFGLLQAHFLFGPCVITEMDSNTVIHPGCKAEVDAVGNLLTWNFAEEDRSTAIETEKQLDTVTVDIFENALRNARNEMDALMTRTTMSPAIREQ